MLVEIEEKAKNELDSMTKQLSSCVKIGYRLAMESFKKEAEKKDLGE